MKRLLAWLAAALLLSANVGYGQEDVTPPSLVAFDYDPKSVDTTSGAAEVTVDYSVTDDLSGAVTFEIYFTSPSEELYRNAVASLSGSVSESGTATVVFPEFIEAGTWTVTYVQLLDAVGNRVFLYPADLEALGFPTELEVVSEEDVTPPSLVAFDYDPKSVDTTSGAAEVTVDYSVTDDLSGAVTFEIYFTSPSEELYRNAVASLSGSVSESGTATVVFPEFIEAGTWTVTYVQLLDAVGNRVFLYPADLEALGFPTERTVSSRMRHLA